MKLSDRLTRSENITAKKSEQPANTRGDRAERGENRLEKSRCPLVNLTEGRTARRLQGTHGWKKKNKTEEKNELNLEIRVC